MYACTNVLYVSATHDSWVDICNNAPQAIMRGVDMYDLSLNMGTSLVYLQSTYLHITTLMKADGMTKDQGIYKTMKERKNKKAAAEKAIREALPKDPKPIETLDH